MSVTLRLSTSRDDDVQARFWTSLSIESIFSRFFVANPEAFRFLSTDPAKRLVLLAEIGHGNVVGLGELIVHEDGACAEVAFAVHERHRRRGIAKRLLAELTTVARARGLSRLVAHVLPSNRAMLDVFRGSGLRMDERHRPDAYELTLHLDTALDLARAA